MGTDNDPQAGWDTWPNLREIVRTGLPLLATVLLGFAATMVVAALSVDFTVTAVWEPVNARDVILISAASASVSLLFSVMSGVHYIAVDYRTSGCDPSEDAKKDYDQRATLYYIRAWVWFLFGLFLLLAGLSAVLTKLQEVAAGVAAFGAFVSLYSLGAFLKGSLDELKRHYPGIKPASLVFKVFTPF